MPKQIQARRQISAIGGDSADAETLGWTYCNAHGRGAVIESTETTPKGTTVNVLSCGHRQPA